MKEFELVVSEAQFPGNFRGSDGEGIVVGWGKGHGVMVK